MQKSCVNCLNSMIRKNCETYKRLIRESNKELSESNKRIKLLEQELNDLKNQKLFQIISLLIFEMKEMNEKSFNQFIIICLIL